MNFLRIFHRKAPYELEADRVYREKIGKLKVEHGEGFDLVKFEGEYDAYRAIQTLANKAKLNWRSVSQEEISALCDVLAGSGFPIRSVLCHGTRNAAEQGFFRAVLPDAEILGTEISETATQFPMTIQWDFHDVKPEWRGHWDVIFSNSWDHTYDPDRLFPAWLSCLAPNGAMVLQWSRIQCETPADPIDPFRANLEGLVGLVGKHAKQLGFSVPLVIGANTPDKRAKSYVIVRRIPH